MGQTACYITGGGAGATPYIQKRSGGRLTHGDYKEEEEEQRV